MDVESIEESLVRIREEQDLDRGVQPRISAIRTRESDAIEIVVPDRAEKSMCLGPGGSIVARLAQELQKHITVVAIEDEIIHRHRLHTTMVRIEEIWKDLSANHKAFLHRLKEAIEKRLEREQVYGFPTLKGSTPAVALSGGVDSCATMILLKEMGLRPVGVTVELLEEHENDLSQRRASDICKGLDCRQVVVKGSSEFREVIERTLEGRIHPCGDCHGLIISEALEAAKIHGLDTLVTGELLPTGRQSLVWRDGMLLVHLPAALALTKYNTRLLCKKKGFKAEPIRFGCSLVRCVHEKGWKGIRPSIYRVLRETQANVLTPGQSIQYVKSILKPILHNHNDKGEYRV